MQKYREVLAEYRTTRNLPAKSKRRRDAKQALFMACIDAAHSMYNTNKRSKSNNNERKQHAVQTL